MFELLGLATLKVLGFGWLWGKEPSGDVFGNGSLLLPIGLLSLLFLILLSTTISHLM